MLGRGRRRVARKDRSGASPFAVGLLVLALACVLVYLGFAKDNPFSRPFEVEAVFRTANNLRTGSPVRVAGVNVGKVVNIARQEGSDAAVITMQVSEQGLPIHKDATLKIRPRIFLEGNFFVDLQPGTPQAPVIGDGDTLKITQTATPVQLDQVLSSLQSDTREDLQELLDGYGDALTREPTAADDAAQDPDARRQTAARSLNDGFDDAGPALRDTAIVTDALLGSRPDDLSALIAGLDRVSRGLGRSEATLQDFVTGFNTTLAAFAAEAAPLRRSIRLLGPTLESANGALKSLNRAFPATRALAREILPGVRETPATIAASFPWIAQTRGLLSAPELRGLVGDLSPATADLAAAANGALALLPQQDLFSQCLTRTFLPTGDVVIRDGPMTTGVENYKEFFYSLVGLAGESQNFDGNGQMVRFAPGGGANTVATGPNTGDRRPLFGNANAKPLGTRPAWPGRRPPFNSAAVCKDQGVPDLNGARTGPADGSRPGVAP